jgi:hypothetical protein
VRAFAAIPLLILLATPALQARAGEGGSRDHGLPDFSAVNSLSEWSIVPLDGARFEGGARLDERQELRFSTVPTGHGISAGVVNVTDLWPAGSRKLAIDGAYGMDQPRATYRYTWLSMQEFDLKVGVTSNLSQFGASLRNPLSSSIRFGALPLMHLSGVGRLTDNWHVSLDADGLWTARGRSLDLGLQVGYRLNRSFQFFGGYRVTDLSGEAEDAYGPATVNSANVGLRYSF